MISDSKKEAIKILKEMQIELKMIEFKIATIPMQSEYGKEIRNQLSQIKIEKLHIEQKIISSLPTELVGFLGEDEDEVDQDERGRTMEIYHYLGCPMFTTKKSYNYGTVVYNKFQDITEILKQHTGEFLKVTIEAIPIGSTKTCAKCNNKFRCLTTKVKC